MSVHMDCGREWKAGDPPPEGYIDWHEWARVQQRAGLRQSQCPRCCCWAYPQERTERGCMKCEEVPHADQG